MLIFFLLSSKLPVTKIVSHYRYYGVSHDSQVGIWQIDMNHMIITDFPSLTHWHGKSNLRDNLSEYLVSLTCKGKMSNYSSPSHLLNGSVSRTDSFGLMWFFLFRKYSTADSEAALETTAIRMISHLQAVQSSCRCNLKNLKVNTFPLSFLFLPLSSFDFYLFLINL